MARKKESRVTKLMVATVFILINVVIIILLSFVLTHNYQKRKQVDICEKSIQKGQTSAQNCFFGNEYHYTLIEEK